MLIRDHPLPVRFATPSGHAHPSSLCFTVFSCTAAAGECRGKSHVVACRDVHVAHLDNHRVWTTHGQTRLLVPHPLLILGYSRFNFVRASSILNCQSTPRCLALVLSAQLPISAWSKGSSPMRRSVRH